MKRIIIINNNFNETKGRMFGSKNILKEYPQFQSFCLSIFRICLSNVPFVHQKE